MTQRVVVTDHIFPTLTAESDAAARAGAAFDAYQCRDEAAVAAATAGADVAVVQFAPMTAAAIAGLNEGGRIIRYGVGHDNVDVASARAQNIDVAYVPDYCTDEVADHTATMILTLLRKLVRLDRSIRDGAWTAVAVAKPMPAMSDAVVGFVGVGRIGRAVMERLRPFRLRFMAYDPALPESVEGLERAGSVQDLLTASDVVTLHVPATAATRGMIDASALATMKSTAVLVNTARGELVNENDLAVALETGEIAGAALDVFRQEPLPIDSPLRLAPNLIMTPHAAWYSDSAIDRLQSLAADEIARGLNGQPPRCPVPEANDVT